MGRKSERSKTKRDKSQEKVDKSPKHSRVGRPSRRRKKSASESDDDSSTAQPPPSVPINTVDDQVEVSDTVRLRKSRRGLVPSTSGQSVSSQPPSETVSDTKPQTGNDWKEDDAFWASNEEGKKIEGDKEETVWKVQTSNGSGGEIQKLRICRQRPVGGSASAGSDSAESSMSPHKETSSSSPLHKRSLKRETQKSPLVESSENQILTVTESNVAESEAAPVNQPSENEFTLPLIGEPEKVVEYVYETQPNFMSIREPSPVRLPLLSPTQGQIIPQDDDNEPVLEITNETLEPDIDSEDKSIPSQNSSTHLSQSELKEKNEDPVKMEVELKSDTLVENKTIPEVKHGCEIKQPLDNSDKIHEKGSLDDKALQNISPTAEINPESQQTIETTADQSPSGKEEGEIVDVTPPSTKGSAESRIIKLNRSNLEDVTPAKISANRRSTSGETTIKSGTAEGELSSQTKATTAKKHPLITGPESDESPSVRRRKLTTLASNTRTVLTPTGTTRQVRSIPGQALKAVLHAEADNKKDKEKRYKLIKSVKDEVTFDKNEAAISSNTSVTFTNNTSTTINNSTTESKLDRVEDVREILKSNRDRKLSLSDRKSPSSETKSTSRKVSIGVAPVKSIKPERSSSPADNKATQVLFITNLVRPFTAGQLKELLARTGTIANNGFFIDKIKSKCFVKYVDVEMAIETRHALNGVRWPVSNPKTLKVSYASEKELKLIQDSAEGEIVDDINVSGSWLSSEQAANSDKEKRKSSLTSTREWDRGKSKSTTDADVIFVDEYSNPKEEKFNRTVSLSNITSLSLSESHERLRERQHLDVRSKNKYPGERDKERERRKRRVSPSHDAETLSPPPVRKFKKKDYDAPAKLLDDLFRKTKTTPCLYWLPLSNQQIAIKEEARKKHMAEAERRMAELKKSQKEREKDRRRK